MERVPTIRDVAQAVGVSTATVSRILNGKHTANEQVQRKVFDAVKNLGYRPDPVMAAVASRHFMGHTKRHDTNVAYVLQITKDGRVQKEVRWAAFQERARELGFSPELYVVDETTRPDSFVRMLHMRGFACVALDRLNGNMNFFQQIDWSHFCVVNMERRLMSPAFDTVRVEIFSACNMLWSELAGRGYQRIGFALFRHHYEEPGEHPDDQVREAFAAWAAQSGLTVPPFFHRDKIVPYDMPQEFRKWMRLEKPDVVVGFSPVIHFWLEALKLPTPKKIGFCSMSDVNNIAARITSIIEPRMGIAREAMDRLNYLFRHGMRGVPTRSVQILLQSHWHEGETLRPKL